MSSTIAVVAPRGRDAFVITAILQRAMIDASTMTLEALLSAVATDVFAGAVITDDALTGITEAAIHKAVSRQPAWSDFPFVLLSNGDAEANRPHLSRALGNVTILERPLHAATLLNAARSTQRARLRQHRMREMLEQQARAEQEISRLAHHLELRVEERTAELADANDRIEREARERAEAEVALRNLQATLLHLGRQSAANSVASALAHELNQPLTAIHNYLRGAERLLRQSGAPTEALDAVDGAARNAHRAGDIIRRLRGLVTNAPPSRSDESLAAIIDDAGKLAMLGPLSQGIAFSVNVADGADIVLVDRIQIGQVFVNLIRNAIEALEGCAARRIDIGVARLDRKVEICVADSGPGFGEIPDDLSHPGFTSTKANGLGIGLSICKRIVEAHGGTFCIANRPQGGASVIFTLPCGVPAGA